MPGTFIHMQAALEVARRLQTGEGIPEDFPLRPEDRIHLARICLDWSNYFELGAVGPDLFFLLPDFKGDAGKTIGAAEHWALDFWKALDAVFIQHWDQWVGPVQNSAEEFADGLTGGLLGEMADALGALATAVQTYLQAV